MASRGAPSSTEATMLLRMSSSVSFTSTPSAVDSPTAGSASMARMRLSGYVSVSSRTKAAEMEVLPTPPLPATAMILGECSNGLHVLSCRLWPPFPCKTAVMPKKQADLCSIVKFLTSYYHKMQQIATKVSPFCGIFWHICVVPAVAPAAALVRFFANAPLTRGHGRAII